MDGENHDIAIIGAGMAGLACASTLASAGRTPILFDKGRGPGGRMATRRVDLENGTQLRFDHGAQYFTARDPAFVAQVAEWAEQGVVAPWPAAKDDAWVGAPGMNAPIRAMAEAATVCWGRRVVELSREGNGWLLKLDDGEEFRCSEAVVAIPAEQAAELLRPVAHAWSARAAAVKSAPCWTAMASFDAPLPLETDTLRDVGVIGWAAHNSAKPGREGPESWVIQASPEHSKHILERERDDVAQQLLGEFFTAAHIDPMAPAYLTAHRWRYAMVPKSEGEPAMWDAASGLGLCGDWLGGPRVENAFLSGRALAELIVGGGNA